MAGRVGPAVGIIRWSAFTSDQSGFVTNFLGSPSGVTVSRVFTEYGHRAPSLWNNYAQFGTGVDHQSIMDAELKSAAGCFDAWIYNWYPPDSAFISDASNRPPQTNIMIPVEAHRASAYKSLVKYALMVDPAWWSHTTMPLSLPGAWGKVALYRSHMVACMQDAAYFRVGGKPVLGVYGYASLSAGNKTTWLAEIDSLVTDLGEPLTIVVMDASTTSATAMNSRGAKYKTTYGPNPTLSGTPGQYTYESQRALDVTQWTWPGSGIQYYTSVTFVQDRRPRNTNTAYVDQPTMPEIQRHIGASFNYTQSGFGTATPELMVGYAWDEVDEGGPGIVPTFQERRRYLDVLKWNRTGVYPQVYLYEIDAAQLHATKTGTWTKSAQTSGMFNGDELVSTANADQIDFTHERCRHLGVLATKGPTRGIAQIYIDGVSQGTVDLYAATTTYQNQVYMSARLAGGTHTISVKDTNTKNASSSSTRIGVDAFRIVYNP